MVNNQPIWIDQEENPKDRIHLHVATPVHSEVSIHYAQSLLELQKQCWKKKMRCTFQLMKSSLVTQGRNLCVSGFLENKDATHLLFIDSDIAFEPESVFTLLKKKKEIISMVYPMKTLNMKKLLKKVQEGNVIDEVRAHSAALTYPVRLTDDHSEVRINEGVIEADHMPTGFMLIERNVFNKLIKAYPEKKIKQKTIINGEFALRPHFWNFFDTHFDPETNTYLGEDFAFCLLWKKIGGKCFVYISDYITHVGEYQYTGRLSDEMTPLEVESPLKSE